MPCGKDKPGGEANGRAEILRGLLCGQTLPALLRIFLLVLHQPSNPCKSADAKTARSSEVLVVPIRNQRFIFRSRLISLRSSQVHRSCEETLSEINFSCILPACDSQLLISCVMSFRYRCVCASSSALCSSRLSAVASVDILRYSSGWNRLASCSMEFFENPRREKLIANPVSGTGLYTSVDPVMLRHVPRETEEGSGEFKIYEYYEAELLQTLLKMDFYRALEAGRVIRRCEFCGRYFLLTKGYHTKYCDQPNPGNPRYTCAQLGYHLKGVKEAAGDDPKAQALRRCKMRIDKDYSRANIDDEQRDKLLRKTRDLFHAAHTAPGVSNEEFERQLASRNLYALCNVERYTNKRGRPKVK